MRRSVYVVGSLSLLLALSSTDLGGVERARTLGTAPLFSAAASDVTDWRLAKPPVSPPSSDYAIAYDTARKRLVAFGERLGYLEVPATYTWEWDGSTWTQRSPVVSPAARVGHAMAYDSARGRTVLFGGTDEGMDPSDWHADTWEWDGSTWVDRTPVTSPGPREFHAMAYDGARGCMVLFGGSLPGATYFGDTWEYGLVPTFYRDADGDGYGDANATIQAVSAPPGYVENGDDCDDTNPAVHPGASETCNGIDDDCNGLVDEDDAGVDSDGDGVHDACDRCPGTSADEIVNAAGCSISQLVPGSWPWKNHGEYVSAVAEIAGEFVAQGLITESRKGAIVSAAARSDVGKQR